MERSNMKMRVERTITFLNLMNETIRRGDRLHSSARAKQCGVSTVVFQKAKELGVFKRDNYGRLLPRPHAIYAPTATMVIRAVDAYLHEASKRRLQKNFSSPAATQPNTQAGDGVLPFTVFDSEPNPEPEAPIAKGLTEAINRLRDAGVKSAVMFVVEL